MIVIAEDSVRFAHSGPSHNLLRPAIAELVSCGPLPLPVSGGGHASAIPTILPLEYMVSNQITPFVKYNMFHAEMKRKRRKNAFLIENMFYNKELDFYVCPMGQHLEFVKRSRRPIEPEAVFGQIKYDNHFKRFSYRGKRLVKAEFAAIAVAHNIRKMIVKGYCVCSEVAVG